MTKLNIIEAGKILGLSQKTLYNRISLGVGPVPIREGRRLLFTIDSLKDYMVSRNARIVESRSVNDDTGHKEAV